MKTETHKLGEGTLSKNNIPIGWIWGLFLTVLVLMGAPYPLEAATPVNGDPYTQCIRDAADFDQGEICTAKDIVIASIDVINGPPSCLGGDTLNLKVAANITTNSDKVRPDIALWFDTLGGDAQTRGNICQREILTPTNPSPNFGLLLATELTQNYLNWGDNDLCGDVSKKQGNRYIFDVTLECVDNDGDGKLDAGACTSWNVPGTDQACNAIIDAIPEQTSKCKCDLIPIGNIDVQQFGFLEVVKVLVPPQDPGLVKLQIDGVSYLNNRPDTTGQGNGGTTGNGLVGLKVTAGTSLSNPSGENHSAGEIASTGTVLTDYTSDIECVDRGLSTYKGGAPLTQADSGPLTVRIEPEAEPYNPGSDVVCTITNQRNPEVKIVKELIPSDDTGKFNLSIAGTDYVTDGVDGADTGFQEQAIGATPAIGETAGTGTSLDDYASSVSCTNGDTSDPGTGLTLTALSAGDQVTCTITNKRKPEVKVVKELIPSDDTGKFNLSIAGTDYVTDGVDGADTGFQEQAVGATPAIGETAGTGTSLDDYASSVSCTNGDTSDPGTGLTLTALSAGDQVTCTITNKRKPEVKVVKELIPSDDTGKFNLSIAGTDYVTDGVDGADTGFQEQAIGATPAIGETAGTGTSLDDYASSVSCTNGDTSDPGTGLTLSALSAGEKVTCTITNNRNPEVKVVKELIPSDDTGKFNLSIAGTDYVTNGGNGADTGFKEQAIGATPAIGETAGTGTTLASYDSSVSCDNGDTSDPGTGLTLSALSAGEKVICTITNKRKPEVKVVKELIPSDDTGKFNLSIAGTDYVTNGGDGANTGFKEQAIGATPAIGETAGTGTSLGNYESSVSCDNGQSSASGTGLTLSALSAGDQVTCTITNKRKPEVKVVKELIPSDDTGKFNLSIAGTDYVTNGGDAANTGFKEQAIGATPAIGETAGTGTTLASYDSSVSCDNGQSSASGTGLTLSALSAGDQVTCTITNKRKPEVKVVKELIPSDDTGKFNLSIAGTDYVTNGGDAANTGFKEQAIGATPAIGETAGTGTTLASYDSSVSCDNGQSSASGTGLTLSALSAGDQVTCTITNKRKPEVKVVKELIPSDDTGKFNLSIAGTDYVTNGGDAANTGFKEQAIGATPAIGETAGTGTTLASYDSSVSCDNGQSSASGTGLTLSALSAGDQVTCTITNKRKPEVKVVKELIPSDDTGKFNLSIAGTDYVTNGGDAANTGFKEQAIGATPAIGETAGTGTTLASYDSSVSCDNGQSSDPGTGLTLSALSAGEKVTCTITNTKRAMVKVNKTESGTIPLSKAFKFELRVGATSTSIGTIFATGTSILPSGLVEFNCNSALPNLCTNVGGVANIVPGGTYQLCEVKMMPGWYNDLTGFTPKGETPEGGDNSSECINITPSLIPGETREFNINNTPPPEGDARTIGFWKNWTSCDGHGNQDPVLDDNLPVTLDTGFVISNTECAVAVDLLDKRKVGEVSDVGDGKKSASDPIYNMVAQLIAAKLNVNARAGQCTAQMDAITDADALLDVVGFDGNQDYKKGPDKLSKGDKAEANTLASILDDYNNNRLCPPPSP